MKKLGINILVATSAILISLFSAGLAYAVCDASTVNTCNGCPTGQMCTSFYQAATGSWVYQCQINASCGGCAKATRGRCDVCTNNQKCVSPLAGLSSECKTIPGDCGAPWPAGCNQGRYLGCGADGGCPSNQQCIRDASGYTCGTPVTACVTPTPTWPPGTTPTTQPTPTVFSPYKPPTNDTFDMVNPLKIGGGTKLDVDQPSAVAQELESPGGIVSRVLKFAFPIAGLILFAMLTWGGFEMILGAASKKSIDAGKNRVTAAVVGFIILFASYWIWQILEVVFGISVL